jgi:hypothetical protein
MWKYPGLMLACLIALGPCHVGATMAAEAPAIAEFRPVPGWPQLPADFKFGPVSAVATDSIASAWRPRVTGRSGP